MTRRLLVLLAICTEPALAAYTYQYTDPLISNQTQNWNEVNTSQLSFTEYGLTSTTTDGGSLIYSQTINDNNNPHLPNNYDISMTLALNQNAGVFITYLRASSTALSGPGIQGTFYSVEIQNPTFSGTSCSATLVIAKYANSTLSIPVQQTVPCNNGMTVRSVYTQVNGINVYINNVWYAQWVDSTPITTGQPGVGARGTWGSNYISSVSFGPLTTIAPGQISRSQMASSTFAISSTNAEVDLRWQPPSDGSGGPGIALYSVVRNSTWINFFQEAEVSDLAPALNQTYTYTIDAVDFHWNGTSTAFTVATPSANDIDFRRVGVKPGGSYWGGGGENIDMRSGNLNFSVPLLNINGRGWSVPFGLSYNSENWREDSGGDWNLGTDVGFGYGWKFQGGSLTPYYSQYWVLDHYLFRDSTGAEYRLNVNTGGIWTSEDAGVYMAYDTTVSPPALYFPDGTFWQFGCTSAGTEQDAGTMYPTLIQDSNGNQITLSYSAGISVTWTNSSGRMGVITDVNNGTYTFTYNSNSIPHLSGITSPYPGGSYSFVYGASGNLYSPISGAQFGTAQMLQSATNTSASMMTSFSYGSNNAGELTQVTFPYGGLLNWAYGTISYTTSRSQREVETRYLTMSAGGTQLTYPISYTGALNVTMHSAGTLTDAGGLGRKQWNFDTTTTDSGFGLQSSYVESNWVSGAFSTVAQTNYTWTPDSLNRPYIGTVTTTLDGIATKKTTQQLDQYGNLTSMSQYDFGASSPTRTYTNTYLSDSPGGHPSGSNYGAEHINNRLLTSTVTENNQTATLANNVYDTYNAGICTNNGVIYTPSGWQWYNYFTGTGNKTNVFRGNVTTNNGMDMIHTYCYATTGAVAMSIDGGHVTTTQTDSTTNYTLPTAITTGSLTMSATWTPILAPSSHTGPNGDTTSIGYDAAARPSKTTTPYGAYTTYTYSTSPAQTTAVVTTTDPNTNGRKTVTKLDGLGRTIEVDSIDAGGTTRSIVLTQYAPCGCSPLGKISQQSQPYAPGGTVYWTVYTYDGLGRTTKVLAPDGASATTYSYSGNTATVTDPAGNSKTFTMDAFGNLTKVVEPDTSQTNTNNQATTNYTYDALNHLVGVSMPRQTPGGTVTQTRTFTYTSGSTITAYLQSANNPENGTVYYTYNADGTLATKWDAKGQGQYPYFLQYLYDSYGRVVTVQTSPGTPTSPSTPVTVLRTYTYDTNSVNPNYSQYASGRLTTVTYGVPSTSVGYNQYDQKVTFIGDTVTEMYSYTQPGQVAGKKLQVARQPSSGSALIATLNATWSYNNEGHLTEVTYPGSSSPSYNYTYDGMGRLNTMTDGNGDTLVNATTYNAAGKMLTGVDTRTYNSMGQLLSITYSNTLNISYSYPSTQNIGKISLQHDNISGETVSYVYDTLNRLTSATGSGWNQGFVYDPFGNLTTKTGSDSWYGVPNSSTNQLGSVDANGNMLAAPSSTGLGYDPENRLILANNSYQQYAYDGQNKRIWAAAWNSTYTSYTSETYYFYSPVGKLMAEFTPNYDVGVFSLLNYGAVRSYFGGRLLGSEDRIGSRGTYFPYGELRGSTSPGDGSVAFATYTYDAGTLLEYADQRYYAATYGRFLSPDPYRAMATSPSDPKSPQSWNRYAYATGDPININDRRGLDGSLVSQDPDYCDQHPEDGSCSGGLYSDMDPCSAGEEFISGVNPCENNGPPPQPPSQAAPPPCNTDMPKIQTTLYNLADDILAVTAQQDAAITAADLLALGATLGSDVETEELDPTVYFNGGHFSLDVSINSIEIDLGGANSAAYLDFKHLFNPNNNGSRYSSPVPTTDPRSQLLPTRPRQQRRLIISFRSLQPISSARNWHDSPWSRRRSLRALGCAMSRSCMEIDLSKQAMRVVTLLTMALLAARGSAGDLKKIWELRLSDLQGTKITDATAHVFALSFSPDGERLAAIVWGKQVARTKQILVILDINAPREGVRMVEYSGPVGEDRIGPAISWSSTGKQLAIPVVFHAIGQPSCILGHTIRAVFYDSDRVADCQSGFPNSDILFFDTRCQLTGSWDIAGKWELSDGSDDRHLLALVYDIPKRTQIMVVDANRKKVVNQWAIAGLSGGWPLFADSGRAICALDGTGRHGAAHCWDVYSGREIGTITSGNPHLPMATSLRARRVILSDYGWKIDFERWESDVGSLEKRVVWDFGTGKEIAAWKPKFQDDTGRPSRKNKKPDAFALSPDGTMVAEGGAGVLKLSQVRSR